MAEDQDWIRVEVVTDLDTYHAMILWCFSNLGRDGWYHYASRDPDPRPRHSVWLFDDVNKSMLFQLTWC